jgi:hypothetical protein
MSLDDPHVNKMFWRIVAASLLAVVVIVALVFWLQ